MHSCKIDLIKTLLSCNIKLGCSSCSIAAIYKWKSQENYNIITKRSTIYNHIAFPLKYISNGKKNKTILYITDDLKQPLKDFILNFQMI